MKPQDFLDMLLPGALECQVKYGIPASFTLAQGALESRWGDDQLVKQANNVFSIKADPSWKGPTYNLSTGEVFNGKRVVVPASWRKYGSIAEALEDRAQFFQKNKRYRFCFNETTGEGWARAVAAAGYATDPNYANILIDVMDGRNLQRFDNLKGV